MSTTVELGKATAEIARLRAAIAGLADEWDADATEHMDKFGQHLPAAVSRMAELLRELLDES